MPYGSETVDFTVPGSAGPHTLYVRGHHNSECGTSSGDFSNPPAALAVNAIAPDFTSTTVQVYGKNSYTALPSESIQVEVTNVRFGKDWLRTSWRFDSGSWTCEDTANQSDDGTDTVSFSVSAPGSVGAHTLQVRVHSSSSSSCPEDSSTNDSASMQVTVSNATQQFLDTEATIHGLTSYTAFPDEVLPLTVTNARFGTNWEGTSYRYGGSGSYTCINTPDHNENGSDSETFFIPEPSSNGTHTLNVRVHTTDNCSDSPSGHAITSMQVTRVSTYPSTANNPNLVASCGLNVILVLDESYSISLAGAIGDVRTAANAFLTGLNNTGANVAIVEFNTLARTVFDFTPVTNANLPVMQNYIFDGSSAPQGGYNPDDEDYELSDLYTNWDDALNKTADLNAATFAPLVVFITDGDPTTYGDGSDIDTSDQGEEYPSNDPRMTHAVAGSNIIKAQGSHTLAVGVGEGLSSSFSQGRLKAVTGNDVYTSGTLNLTTTDVMVVSNFNNLAAALQNIVTALCQSSVSITKLVDPGTGVYAPASGWQFSGTGRYPAPNGTTFNWTQPSAAPGTQSVAGSTGVNGTLTFQWKPTSGVGTSTLTVQETLKPGYAFEDVVCTKTSGTGSISLSAPNTNPFTISGIAPDAVVTCEVKNKLIANPSILLTKTATEANFNEAGDILHYTLVAKNTGNVSLSNVQISDPKLGTLTSCTPALGSTLAPNTTMTCSGSYLTTQADVNAGKVDNTATATGTPPVGANVTDTDVASVPGDQEVAIQLTKDAEQANYDEPGDIITYTLIAKNTGNVTLSNVQISDPKLGTLTACAPALGSSLAPDASITCSGSYTVTLADIDAGKVDNTATATGDDPNGEKVTDNDDESVPAVQDPKIELTKDAEQASYNEPGDVISYTLVATNTGNVTLSNVQISDPKLGTLTACAPALGSSLAPDASITCSGSYTVTLADIDAGKVDNTATATGTPPVGPNVTDIDDASVPAVPDPSIVLTKVKLQTSFDAIGDVISYTLVATNTGNVTLSNVEITDPKIAVLSCLPSQPATLLPGASITCTGSYVIQLEDIDAAKFDNTATVTGEPPSGANVSDSDDESIPGVHAPSIEMTKDALEANFDEPGDVIHYTLVAKNTGNVSLSNVQISDPKLDAITSCSPILGSTLVPGAAMICSGSYIVTQADVDAGHFFNTAAVVGEDPDGDTVQDTDDETVPAIQEPKVEITKLAEQVNYDAVGDIITYTLVATNTGNVTLSNVEITDPKLGALASCVPALDSTLAPGESMTCTDAYSVSQTDVDTGHIFNTATVTGQVPDGSEVKDTDDEIVPGIQDPAIQLLKEAEQAQYDEAGDVISYTLVATNTGNVTLSNVEITDPKITVLSCLPSQPANLLPWETITCAGSYTVTLGDVDAGQIDNTATVTGTSPSGANVTDADDETVPGIRNPAVGLTKVAQQSSYDAVGDLITYTLVATNTGNVTLNKVTISDPLLASISGCTPVLGSSLTPGATMTCSGTYTITQTDLDKGSFYNIATATGTPPEGDDVEATDDETVTAEKNPALAVDKEAEQGSYDEVGDVISYTIVATNSGNITLHNVTISDPKVPVLTCTPTQPASLAPGETLTCEGSYIVTLSDLEAGLVVNTAVGDSEETDPTEDEETVPGNDVIDLELDKSVSESAPNVGTEIVFTLVVTNQGLSTATGVTVEDVLPSGYTYVSDDGNYDSGTGIWNIGTLTVGASATLQITVTVNGEGGYTNYAQVETADQTDIDSTPGNDSTGEDDDDTVVVEPFNATASIGDRVWLDSNNNGMQDEGEAGIAGVEVKLYQVVDDEPQLIGTTTTDEMGLYSFTGLFAGDYIVEFGTLDGYVNTQYNVFGNSQEEVDSDAVAPVIAVSISDGDVEAEFDENLTYTINYTNTDPALVANSIVLTTTVPPGTTFNADKSTPGWSCTDPAAGSICTFEIASLAANTFGETEFVVKLKDLDAIDEFPDVLVLVVSISHTTIARTQLIQLSAGETNTSTDAGLTRTDASELTPAPTGPTNLPETEQPKQRMFIFLPALRLSDPTATSSAVEQPQAQEPEAVAPKQSISTYLPTVEGQE